MSVSHKLNSVKTYFGFSTTEYEYDLLQLRIFKIISEYETTNN